MSQKPGPKELQRRLLRVSGATKPSASEKPAQYRHAPTEASGNSGSGAPPRRRTGKAVGRKVAKVAGNPPSPRLDALARRRAADAARAKAYRDRQRTKRLAEQQQSGETP